MFYSRKESPNRVPRYLAKMHVVRVRDNLQGLSIRM